MAVPRSPEDFFGSYVPARLAGLADGLRGKSSPGSIVFRMGEDRTWCIRLHDGAFEFTTSDASDASDGSDASVWERSLSGKIATLTREIEGQIRFSGQRAFVVEPDHEYPALFDSPARTHAMVLQALLAAGPDHPLAEPLARGLLAERQGGRWRSTQETSFALLALDAYRSQREAQSPRFDATVRLGRRAVATARHRGRRASADQTTVPMSKLPLGGGTLAFEKQGRGTLYYEALLRYTRRTLPHQSLDRGLSIQHTLHRQGKDGYSQAVLAGHAPGESSFAGGDTILGDVVVFTPTRRNYVVIDVPLPAGLEAIDRSLAIHAGPAPIPNAGDDDSPWHHQEIRDDRVVFFVNELPPGTHRFRYLARATTRGRFVLPPARAEEMYAPEIFGRTGVQTVVVR